MLTEHRHNMNLCIGEKRSLLKCEFINASNILTGKVDNNRTYLTLLLACNIVLEKCRRPLDK